METLDNPNVGVLISLGALLLTYCAMFGIVKFLIFFQKRRGKIKKEVEHLRVVNIRAWEPMAFMESLRSYSMHGDRESASRSFSGGSAGRDLNLVSPAKCKIEFEGRELDFVVFKDKGRVYFMN